MGNFLSETDFERYRNLIYDESGIHFSSSNRTILESRLKERLRKQNISTVGEYYTILTKDRAEMKALLDAVTTNLTRFFRNTAHFQTFEYYALPDLIKWKQQKGDRSVKLWSAGCSTGEEPYSLAMAMKELLPTGFKIDITASDLSLKSLMTAKEGFYSDIKMNGVIDRYLKRYFEKKSGGYQVIEEIRNLIKFDYHNLKFESGLKNLDIVFCRNVIIYFDEAAQEAVINKFYDAMSNHAFLFIGHSESLFGMNTKFEFLKTDWACIYQKMLEK
jgi:chemotaxis protein methyltransferase CheR